ncbi:hypothetical protein N1851_018390 [Merluccius polli]|uniref:Endonuclease/exonuclease/phosphatase domain-containing protein n=1 Tax=Merluccius polli TaxID=89951 RepID=A0AA47P0H2_MERPO|nr:hypothetical protein N1851_018390 [Merluccius polli]
MAAVRLATVQAVFLSVILVPALLVCKVLCVIQYTRSELLNLRSISHSDLGPSTSLLEEKLWDLNISSHSTPWLEAKKGRRSGTFARFRRRPYRPPLPALLLSNVRSLRHKMDELQLMIQTNKDYSDCSAICLTETWLDPSVPDQVANANTTIAELANYVSSVENSHPDTAVIVLGDFNQTNLSSELTGYHQQVTCPSRGTNTLDHCYTTIQEAYHLSRGFRWADWDVFDAAGDLDDVTDAVTSYVNYCVDLCIPLKKAKHYNNNKLWFNKDIKGLRKEKNSAHLAGNKEQYMAAKYKLRSAIRRAKSDYATKLEEQITTSDTLHLEKTTKHDKLQKEIHPNT